jgi:hypothetical protein
MEQPCPTRRAGRRGDRDRGIAVGSTVTSVSRASRTAPLGVVLGVLSGVLLAGVLVPDGSTRGAAASVVTLQPPMSSRHGRTRVTRERRMDE